MCPKTFRLLLLFTLLLFKGMAQDTTYTFIKLDYMPEVRWVNQIFKGKVKGAISTDYKYENDSLKDAGFTKWKFNEYGQMTDFSWQIIGHGYVHGDSTTYRFNDDHLLEEVRWYNDITDELYRITHYTYNKNNLLKYIHVYDKDGKIFDSTVFHYKKDTLYPVEVLQYRTHTWREGNKSKDSIELSSRHLCRYDDRNNFILRNEYDAEGKWQVAQNRKYDKNNHCIEEGVDVGNPRKLVWSYDLNQQGYILLGYEVNDGRRDLYKINRYDSSKLIYQSLCRGKMLHSEEEWKYDAMGKPIFNKIQRADAPTRVTTISYEYDKNGNFTKRLSSLNNVPETLHERVIVYY